MNKLKLSLGKTEVILVGKVEVLKAIMLFIFDEVKLTLADSLRSFVPDITA